MVVVSSWFHFCSLAPDCSLILGSLWSVDAEYVLLRREAVVNIPTDIDPAEAAPLLCAGVTVFNSMRNQNAGPGDLVAIQGIGGLGHLALQFAAKMGFRVAALSSSDKKKDLATKLGAQEFIDGSMGPQDEALRASSFFSFLAALSPRADQTLPTSTLQRNWVGLR